MTDTKDYQVPASRSTPTSTRMSTYQSFVLIAGSALQRGIELDIVELDPKDIRPYKGNPRINDKTIEHLMRSITDYGFRQPIVVDEKMVVLAGHARLKAAIRLGLPKVPVIIASGLTEEQARAYRLADNKVADLTMWDDRLLQATGEIMEDALASYGMDFGGATSKGSPERSEHHHICPRCKHEF